MTSIGLWALVIAPFVNGTMVPNTKGGMYTSEVACQSVQVEVVADNRQEVLNGTLLVVCIKQP